MLENFELYLNLPDCTCTEHFVPREDGYVRVLDPDCPVHGMPEDDCEPDSNRTLGLRGWGSD